ncbi:uncharacterized protein LOC141652647 isoform X2 [Silene latifolia]|uniref:uncharacterized protein LOC141652647 isoform X2 n=1 Tax=Silene latifolia TaxID=37657 RepID=UPI003D76F393
MSMVVATEQVEIEAVNLVYLHMGGKDLWSKVVLKNTPNLVDAMFWGPCFSDVAPIFRQNSQLAQISKLSLYVTLDVLSPESLPTFCNLKQLTLMVDERFEDELIAPINQFLKACPKLCEFKVEFTDVYNDSLYDEAYQLKELDSSNDDDDDDKTENVRDWEYFEMSYNMELGRKGHSNLREFLVAGFYGCDEDVELILFIVLISCNLETIICDCSHAHTDDGEVTQEVQVLKSRAAKLVKVIPPKITLVVI